VTTKKKKKKKKKRSSAEKHAGIKVLPACRWLTELKDDGAM